MPKAVFMGRKPAAVEALDYLIQRNWDIIAVVCPPDPDSLWWRPTLVEATRKWKLPIVDQEQLLEAIKSPEREPELANALEGCDVVISYLYWRRVRRSLLELPSRGAVNFHPAPLPRYQGLGGYNFAILEGDASYGVSAHYMSSRIDHGKLIKVETFPIDQENETALSLYYKTQARLLGLFRVVMPSFENGRPLGHSQPPGRYIGKDEFESAKIIPPEASPLEVQRRARAFWFPPYPGARYDADPASASLVPAVVLEELTDCLHRRSITADS